MHASRPNNSLWLWTGFAASGLLALLASLYAIFVVAPTELQMGIVQKIFYIHVPCAYAMYLGFFVCGVTSFGFLIRKTPTWDYVAASSGEVGLLFCALVLTTGPLWARKAWGVYWTWDPRLTTTLLAGLIFASHWVLRNSAGAGAMEKKIAAAVAVFGILDLPIIHYSVQRWRGTHPTVISNKGGGLHPDMYPALWLSFVAFTFLAIGLIWLRTHLCRLQEQYNRIELMTQERAFES